MEDKKIITHLLKQIDSSNEVIEELEKISICHSHKEWNEGYKTALKHMKKLICELQGV